MVFCDREFRYGGVHERFGGGKNRVLQRFVRRDPGVDVHVLHLDGCCGLAVLSKLRSILTCVKAENV